MSLRIPAGGLTIGFDAEGKLDAHLTLHLAVDVCPTWLEIALVHLAAAQASNQELTEAAKRDDEEAIASYLDRDLRASMQSIVASATAVDSFYAVLQRCVPIDSATKNAWRDKRTARYKQIAETLRRAFRISPRNAVRLRQALKELYRYRDICVHPDQSYSEAVHHPEARRSTARLFVTYRYPNARELASVSMSVIAQACLQATSPHSDVTKHCEELRPRVAPILEQWESQHGQVFKRAHDSDAPPINEP
jgi:hypothetical protein